MKVDFKYGYQDNEWSVIEVNILGERVVTPFNTLNAALEYLAQTPRCIIGVVTTNFLVHKVEE